MEQTRYESTLAFMWESNKPFAPTPYALESGMWDEDYPACWATIPERFDPDWVPPARQPLPFDPDASR